MSKLIHYELSKKVLTCAFTVNRILGPGLLESAYEGAMVVELQNAGLSFGRQVVYPLYYKNECIGAYIADLVVANTIVLELKSVQALHPSMTAQLLNYLRLSGCRIGYLLNFYNIKLEFKRYVN